MIITISAFTLGCTGQGIVTPTALPTPTATPTPVSTPTIDDLYIRVNSALVKALGKGQPRKGVDRLQEVKVTKINKTFITVRWAIKDNLTGGLIKDGARSDITTILNTIHNLGINYDEIYIEGTFSMRDLYGEVSESVIIRAFYERSTIDRINWNNFLSKNVLEITDRKLLNPGFWK
jgi:hypothetical protein